LCCSIVACAQVYNYDPVRHHNFETNPSILASDYNNIGVSVTHHRAHLDDGFFSYSSFKTSKYLPRAFTGIGLSLNHTEISKGVSYNHISLGAAYRNVIFDAIYVKLGALYKLVQSTAPSGLFDSYAFFPLEDANINEMRHSLNYSFAISSPSDFFYVSMGMLNWNPFDQSDYDISAFPTYRFINVGNLWKVFNRSTNHELNYTGFTKDFQNGERKGESHYVTFLFGQVWTRYSYMKYGFRAGVKDDRHLEISPMLSYYINKGTWRDQHHFLISVSLRMHFDRRNYNSHLTPIPQLSLIYKTGS